MGFRITVYLACRALHVRRSDRVWFNLEYFVAYIKCWDSLLDTQWHDAFSVFDQYADLQIVSDGTTAGILGIQDKQLRGLGAPLPETIVNSLHRL
jgi:hypothetical protein